MSTMTLYVDNTGLVQLNEYKNGLTGEYINDAIVSLELKDSLGVLITGMPANPVTLSYVTGTNGSYQASISESAVITSGDFIKGILTATSSGIQSKFNCTVLIQERKC